jgi:hypothetical protein
MNKKLLSSSALVGAMLISGAALAEFKVGGDITATYITGSDESGARGTNGLSSGETIGNEYNLLMTGSNALSNGMTAKYSGKLEFDGASAGEPDHEYELKLESANGFYIGFANDGGQSNRTSMTPFVSYPIGSVGHATGGAQAAGSTGAGGFAGDSFSAAVHTSNNIAIGGKIGDGNFVARYAPNTAEVNGNDVTVSTPGINADATGDTGSGMMFAYNGKFSGLGVNLGYTTVQQATESNNANGDIKEKRIGLNYTFGNVKVGADYIEGEDGTVAQTKDRETTIIGLAYAVSKEVTVGVYHQTTSPELTGGGQQDEDMNMLTIGYNLGAGSIALSVVDVDGFRNAVNGTEAEHQGILIATKVGF